MNNPGKRLRAIFFILLGGVSILISGTSVAQTHEIGFTVGAMTYKGELSPQLKPLFVRPGVQGYYRFNLDPAWTLKASLLGGQISADDEKSDDPLPQARALRSNTRIIELGAFVEYNFLDYRKKTDFRFATPYFVTGLALTVFSQQLVRRNEGSDGTTVALPLGLGMRMQLSRKHEFFRMINLNLEVTARKTFTDYLDGVKDHYLTGGQQAGDPYGSDWYYFAGIGITYTFYRVQCPSHL